MNELLILITKLIAILLISIIGYFSMRKHIFASDATNVISILLNNIALPLMIFSSYTKVKLDTKMYLNILIIIIFVILIYLVNYLFSYLMTFKSNLTLKQKTIYINGLLHSNTAYLAFPLINAVFSSTGLFYATIYFMVDNFLFTTIGIKRMKNNSDKTKMPAVTYALIISLLIMILLNIFNIDITNTFIYISANEIGIMCTPLAFLFMGFLIYESNIKQVIFNLRALQLVIIKMSITPLLLIITLYLLNLNLEAVMLITIITQALMPPFSGLIPMSYLFKQDTFLATSIVVIGHIYALISIPLLFSLSIILFNK